MIRPRQSNLFIAAVLALWTGVVYAPAVLNGFISNYDDALYVTANAMVQRGLTAEGLVWAFTTGHAANWHPLTWLSHMADVTVFGLNPAGHHAVSVAIHIVNTILLFLALERLTGRRWPSAAAAAFFALHPLHVESVAWIAERKDVLSTFFWFLCLWLYPAYVKKRTPLRYAGLLACLALGLMAKPMVVTLPCTLLLLDLWPLRRIDLASPDRGKQAKALLFEKIPMFAIAAASCWLTVAVQSRGTAVTSLDAFPYWVRAANALNGYGFYLLKTVVPTGLAPYYPHPGANVSISGAVIAAVVLLALSLLCRLYLRRRPYLLVGWLWFLGTLVPVIGLVQVGNQAYADRYTYVPMVGLAIAGCWAVADWAPSRRAVRFTVAAACGILIALSAGTMVQIGYWKNGLVLFERTLAVTRNNPLALNNLATALLERGEGDRAEKLLRDAVAVNPHYSDAHYNLGRIAETAGRNEEALSYYRTAAESAHGDPDPWINQAALLVKMGDYDASIAAATAALGVDPAAPMAYLNLGAAHAAANRPNEALAAYVSGLQADPSSAALHNNLANLLARLGTGEQLEKALHHFQQALRLDPAAAETRFNMAVLLDQMGRRDEADRELRRVLAEAPGLEAARRYAESRNAAQ